MVPVLGADLNAKINYFFTSDFIEKLISFSFM